MTLLHIKKLFFLNFFIKNTKKNSSFLKNSNHYYCLSRYKSQIDSP